MALLFGLSFVATKYALESVPPFTLIFLRFLVASLFLGLVFRARLIMPAPADRGKILLTSMIVPGLYFLAETYGLKYASATSVSLMIATIPIFTAVFAFLLLREKIGVWRGSGIVLSVVGVAAILQAGPGSLAGRESFQAGNLLGLGAALCAGLYVTLGRRILLRTPPLVLTAFQAFLTVLLFLPLAGWEMATFRWEKFNPLALAAILYLALFCSVLAFFLWNYGISRLEAGRASTFSNLVPVFTLVGAALLLGERVQPGQIFGGGLVIMGVTMAGMARSKAAGAAAEPAP